MIRPLLIAIFLAALGRSAFGAEPSQDLTSLRSLMAERLAVMEYVAAFKWNERLPIDDETREAKVLEQTLARNNIDAAQSEDVTRAVRAQIEAAKRVQHALFRQWDAEEKARDDAVPDLQISLRPKISRMSNALIAMFLASQDELETCEAQDILGPVPAELANFPKAWEMAVEGVLDLEQPCRALN